MECILSMIPNVRDAMELWVAVTSEPNRKNEAEKIESRPKPSPWRKRRKKHCEVALHILKRAKKNWLIHIIHKYNIVSLCAKGFSRAVVELFGEWDGDGRTIR